MTQTIKSLGQLDCGTALATLYTVPGATSALAYVTFANRGTVNVTVRLAHSVGGSAIDAKHYLLYDFAIPGTAGSADAWTTPHPLALAATDVLRVRADTASVVSCNAYGIEIT